MAQNNFMFNPGYSSSYDEEGMFQSDLFMPAEANVMDSSVKFIDPNLQSPPPSAPYSQCDLAPQPVQRYLNDLQKTAFFNADFPIKMSPNRALSRSQVMGIAPIHGPSHARLASPTSSREPSSSSGSVRSPPADTESYCDHAFPATPPDTATLLSPYIRATSTPYEHLNIRSPLHFTNMGPSQANAYVNPVDMHPTHFESFYETEPSIDFNLQAADSFGYDGYDPIAQFDLDQPQAEQTITVDSHRTRLASPGANQQLVKDEIEAAYRYPDPSQPGDDPAEGDGHDHDYNPEAVSKRPSRSKQFEDEKFKPAGKRTRSGIAASIITAAAAATTTTTTTTTNNNKTAAGSRRAMSSKRSVAVRSLEDEAQPPRKKAKAAATAVAVPATAKQQLALFPCPHCRQNNFKDKASLDLHIKKQHTRPYHCVFHFSGCTSTFASKNEWKRHVASQHLLLSYWLCQEGPCARLANDSSAAPSASGTRSRSRGGRAAMSTVSAKAGPSFGPPLPNGAIFNRKDLYTQHLRRMHTPPNIKKQAKQQQTRKGSTANGNLASDWEAHLRRLATRAMRERCMLPNVMRCPAPHCDQEFRGAEAWDQRMEHVGRHLERAADGKEDKIEFGGANDPTLVEWASRGDVAVIRKNALGHWELNNPLKPTAKPAAKPSEGGEIILAMPGAVAEPSVAIAGDDEQLDYDDDDDDNSNDDEGEEAVENEIIVEEDAEQDAEQDAEGEDDYF